MNRVTPATSAANTNTKRRGGPAPPDTYHVHETVFSTLAGNIVCLPLPVVNTTALSHRLTLTTVMHLCVFESSSMCVWVIPWLCTCVCVCVRRTCGVSLHVCVSGVKRNWLHLLKSTLVQFWSTLIVHFHVMLLYCIPLSHNIIKSYINRKFCFK